MRFGSGGQGVMDGERGFYEGAQDIRYIALRNMHF